MKGYYDHAYTCVAAGLIYGTVESLLEGELIDIYNKKKDVTKKAKENAKHIQNLASLVDSKYEHKEWSRDRIGLWILSQILALLVIFYILLRLFPYISQPALYIAFFLGLVAVYASLMDFIKFPLKRTPKEVIEWNHEKSRDKEKKEQPLLLALITMKNKQPKLFLSKALEMNKSLFDPQRLI